MTHKFSALMLTAGLAITGGLSFAASPALAGPIQHIACPVASVTRQITTPLSNGWWQTTDVNNLQSTAIQVIGGKKTLACLYGYAGQIMHLQPAGMDCTPVSGGFDCKAPTPVGPSVHSAGTVNIPQTYIVDLDSGGLIASGPGDIWFEAATATQFYLTPVNGAKMNVGGPVARGYAGCASVGMGGGKVNLAALAPGTHVCVRTNAGHVAEFRFNNIWGGATKTLNITYTTWN